ncbi:MAG: uracil-DNA glycosylase [Alphaproteobacteria bacterium]|jgi:uracil-DNA glycosylase family 4|nr:uracil-DNA glycosylase [Alphaproteobacteria bacterium]
MNQTEKEKNFVQLCSHVKQCSLCPRMSNSARVLNASVGSLNAKIMFIGEAPGRLGADGSEIPFHGDKAGDNFEKFLDQVGISRYDIYVTNAALCNPKDAEGNNSTPTFKEVENCSNFLKQQIELVNPEIVVTLGSTALKALSLIQNHALNLKDSVRTASSWYGRQLIPLYHPGQRALIHRSFLNQLADYQFVAEQIKRLGKSNRKVSPYMKEDVISVADFLTCLKPHLSYFALHKLFYMVEYEFAKNTGSKLTGAFFIRQKDGPYCTDLHIRKLQNHLPDLRVSKQQNKVFLIRNSQNIFEQNFLERFKNVNSYTRDLVIGVIEKYGEKTDSELKTRVYLTPPMRRILALEKMNHNLFNMPIEFVEA